MSPIQSHLYDHRYSFHPALNNIHTNIHIKKKKRRIKRTKENVDKSRIARYRLTILIKIERIVRNVHAKLRVNFWIARFPRFIRVLNKCLLVFFLFVSGYVIRCNSINCIDSTMGVEKIRYKNWLFPGMAIFYFYRKYAN